MEDPATNDAQADYLEYAVFNGNSSTEVQIDLDNTPKMATKVDVASCLWRGDSTKAALKGQPFTAMTSGGPLMWPRISESEQNSLDTTCRKLNRFLRVSAAADPSD